MKTPLLDASCNHLLGIFEVGVDFWMASILFSQILALPQVSVTSCTMMPNIKNIDFFTSVSATLNLHSCQMCWTLLLVHNANIGYCWGYLLPEASFFCLTCQIPLFLTMADFMYHIAKKRRRKKKRLSNNPCPLTQNPTLSVKPEEVKLKLKFLVRVHFRHSWDFLKETPL